MSLNPNTINQSHTCMHWRHLLFGMGHIIAPEKVEIRKIFCLFLHKNICYGYSLEVPQRGSPNEYPQHMCSQRNKEHVNNSWSRKGQRCLVEKKNKKPYLAKQISLLISLHWLQSIQSHSILHAVFQNLVSKKKWRLNKYSGCAGWSEWLLLYARLKNGTYYVTGYGVRPSVNFFVFG